jgi:hypothetical protein
VYNWIANFAPALGGLEGEGQSFDRKGKTREVAYGPFIFISPYSGSTCTSPFQSISIEEVEGRLGSDDLNVNLIVLI